MKKKLFVFATLFLLSVATFAQVEVTRFLGIPVDGFKKNMIQKLEAKGFSYNPTNDFCVGEFNGENVQIFIQTKNNKVWRLVIADRDCRNESQIKIRYNSLCNQFLNNKKYVNALDHSPVLSDEEDINYNMMVNNKEYQAAFYQAMPVKKDSVALSTAIQGRVFELLKRDYNLTIDSLKNMPEDKAAEIVKDVTQKIMIDVLDETEKRSVWFAISSNYPDFRIVMYYENEYNNSHGEDL